MPIIKRFVAGAVCPRCNATDRIRIYRESGGLFQDCIACGFREEMNSRDLTDEASIRFSVNGNPEQEDPQPITFIATSGGKKDSD